MLIGLRHQQAYRYQYFWPTSKGVMQQQDLDLGQTSVTLVTKYNDFYI